MITIFSQTQLKANQLQLNGYLTDLKKQNKQHISLTIDTGFEGFLYLSKTLAKSLKLEITGTQKIYIGDNQEISVLTANSMLGFDWINTTFDIPVLIGSGDEIVLGINLLKKLTAQLQCSILLNLNEDKVDFIKT
ncbi:MAG: hypothetical protein WCK98_00055 [bacterium]